MNSREFAMKAQEFLPEYVLSDIEKQVHTGTITSTCKGHMLLSYILEYGATLMSQSLGQDEIKKTIWGDIEKFVETVNEQHLASMETMREKYPEEFAEAEAKASKSSANADRKLALLREMLGQDSQN